MVTFPLVILRMLKPTVGIMSSLNCPDCREERELQTRQPWQGVKGPPSRSPYLKPLYWGQEAHPTATLGKDPKQVMSGGRGGSHGKQTRQSKLATLKAMPTHQSLH